MPISTMEGTRIPNNEEIVLFIRNSIHDVERVKQSVLTNGSVKVRGSYRPFYRQGKRY